ncbi:uncharacterized protein TNCV_1594431 [Trichonephila clavipes]|nr:uncharacterized protein TNCV_1594431 [Trichonephila clavipes]
METDPPDITNSCEERNRLSLEIEARDKVINRCTELVNFPDTDDNHKMKAILRASIDDIQTKKGIQWGVSFVPSPYITNKSSGEFIKLIANDIEEYHAFTNFLEEDKDFEFFSLKPKPIKPIKIVIEELPIFTKTHEIQSDLEEEGFTIENVSQLISKKTKTALSFFQVTLPRNANNQKIFGLKTVGYMQVKIEVYLIRGITQCFNCNNFLSHGRKLPPQAKMSKVWKRTPHPSMPDKGATGKPLLHKLPRI